MVARPDGRQATGTGRPGCGTHGPGRRCTALLVTACWGDARTPEPDVLVPVLRRVVERPAAHHPPPGLSRLPWRYSATCCLACQAPLQMFLPAPELAPDVVCQGQCEVPLAFCQPGRFYGEPKTQTQAQENQVRVLQGAG